MENVRDDLVMHVRVTIRGDGVRTGQELYHDEVGSPDSMVAIGACVHTLGGRHGGLLTALDRKKCGLKIEWH